MNNTQNNNNNQRNDFIPIQIKTKNKRKRKKRQRKKKATQNESQLHKSREPFETVHQKIIKDQEISKNNNETFSILEKDRPSLFDIPQMKNNQQNIERNEQNIFNKQRPSLFDTVQQSSMVRIKDEQIQEINKNNTFVNILEKERPSLFDIPQIKDNEQNVMEKQRPSLFDTVVQQSSINNNNQNINNRSLKSNENEFEFEGKCNIIQKPTISKSKKKKKIITSSKYDKDFASLNISKSMHNYGMRQENEQTFLKRENQKKILLYQRFNINNKKKKIKHEESKPHINLVIIGHVDAGKSTLMGHLLFKIGKVSNAMMHKNRKQSSEIGKSSFAFAWLLDCHSEERMRGITMDVSTNYFETDHRCITLLDSPGHRGIQSNTTAFHSSLNKNIQYFIHLFVEM